jgi:hypothetical protein
VDLEEFIVAAYCLVDELLAELRADPGWRRVRRRGPAPTLADSEVLTMEVVGEYLGHDTDQAIYAYFRRHHAALFPRLLAVHRTTFARQAANLWAVKERLWRLLLDRVPHDPALSLVDSVPAPVCRFARATRCRRLRGAAAFGWDASSRATYYGVRHHLRVCWPGVLTAVSVAPANAPDVEVLPELVEGAAGVVVGDRAYWHPGLGAELAPAGIALLAPFRQRSRDPAPARSRLLSRVRQRVETVAAQFAERYGAKRIWARDAWHLTSRTLRKVLSHTVAVCLAVGRGHEPLHLARLLA